MKCHHSLAKLAKFMTIPTRMQVGTLLLCSMSAFHAFATDYSMYPFASTSIWKTPIGTGATYQSLNDTESALLRNQNAGCTNCAWPWIQGDAFGVYQASSSDTVMQWTYKARPGSGTWPYTGGITNGSFSIPTPSGIEFLGSTDRHAVIVSPDKKSAIEIWHGAYNSTTKTYSADFIAYMDLTGSGISPTDGVQVSIRAYGGSLMGGIVRKEELDAGAINHPLAMAISPHQLKEGTVIYQNGTTIKHDMSTQKVWPATTDDGLGYNAYSGSIPMGALFALPADTDIDSLGLTTEEGKTLAKAFKYYGGYVVDAATNTTSIAALEASCTDEQVNNLQVDKRKILNKLVMITNNSAEHIGGPGSRLIDIDNQSTSISVNTGTTTASADTSSSTDSSSTDSSSSDTTSASTSSDSTTTADTSSSSESTATTADTGSSSDSTTTSDTGSSSSDTSATVASTATTSTDSTSTSTTSDNSASSSETSAAATVTSLATTSGSDTATSSSESTDETTTTSSATPKMTYSSSSSSSSSSGGSSSGSSSSGSSSSSLTSSTSSSSDSSTGSGVVSYGASDTSSDIIDTTAMNEIKSTLMGTSSTATTQASTSAPTTKTTTSTGTTSSCTQVSCFKSGSLGNSAETQQNTLVAAGQ